MKPEKMEMTTRSTRVNDKAEESKEVMRGKAESLRDESKREEHQ